MSLHVSVCAMLCLVAHSCPAVCKPMDYSLPGSSVSGDSPGKNTGVGCHSLLQGIFPAQWSNPGLPHCRWSLDWLSQQGSPCIYIYMHIYLSIHTYTHTHTHTHTHIYIYTHIQILSKQDTASLSYLQIWCEIQHVKHKLK